MHYIDFTKKMTYLKALILPFKISPYETLANTINGLVGMAIAPIGVFVTAYFIDTALNIFAENTGWRRIALPLMIMIVFKLYNYLIDPILSLINIRQSQKTWLAIDHPFISTRATLEIKHFENDDTMNLIDRVCKEPSQLAGYWGTFTGFLFTVIRVLSYIIILIVNVPLAGIIISASAILMSILGVFLGKEIYAIDQELTKPARLQEGHFKHLNDRSSVHERNLFGYAPFLNQRFWVTFEYIRKRVLQFTRKSLLRMGIGMTLTGCLSIFSIFLMLPYVADGTLTVGMYIALLGMLGGALTHIRHIVQFVKDFSVQQEYVREFNQYIQLSRFIGAVDPIDSSVSPFKKLEFRNVSFTYPGTNKVIFENLFFTIEEGKRYALVGENGSGKTTLAKIILRFYDDYTGEIFLNGINLREWPMGVVKGMITAVFQDFLRYDISLADNVAAGAGFMGSIAEVERALTVAKLDETVASLNSGKDTLLGKVHDGGIELSGGQWQKVALARAVVSPAQLKILDEPTAALDPVAEQEIYTHFDEISRGAATLFISHRLASAKMADVIFVLHKKRIVERGSHNELMEQKGLYAEMFEQQRGWYI